MNKILDKIVDYYISKTVKDKIVTLLISSGVVLIAQNLFGQLIEQWLFQKYGVTIPDLKLWGAFLIGIGIAVIILDIKFTLIPSVFATTKTTRIIFLGNMKYQFLFDKRMRCAPVICFSKPKYQDNKPSLTNVSNKGFIVEFEKEKLIEEIEFSADAWQGITFQQKIYLSIANFFRNKDNKFHKSEYQSSFVKRQIDRINNK
jgi:hypothetical protein